MLQLIIEMLTTILSKKTIMTKLVTAINSYLNANSEEERESAYLKVTAFTLLLAGKVTDNITDQVSQGVMMSLKDLTKEYYNSSKEETQLELDIIKEEKVIQEKREAIEQELRIAAVITEESDTKSNIENTDDDELHVHDCDSCGAIGNCPIEGIMREVKAGNLSPKEGRVLADGVLNAEEHHTVKEEEDDIKIINLCKVTAEA